MAYINIFNYTDAIIFNVLQGGSLESILGTVLRPNYAIYDSNNNRILRFDGFLDASVKASSDITRYPVENGNYGSINKVKEPKTVRMSGAISMLTGFTGSIPNAPAGNLTSVDDIVAELDKMRDSTKTYIVETPQAVIKSLDLQDYSWKVSSSEGVSLLIIDLVFDQINQEMITTINDSKELMMKIAQSSTKKAPLFDMTSIIANLKTLSPQTSIDKAFTTATDTIDKLAADIPNSTTSASNNAAKTLSGLLS